MPTVAELKTTFDHASPFGSEELTKQAISTLQEFKVTLRRTFKELVEIGQKLLDLRARCFEERGVVEGKKAFDDWLASEDFGGSRYLAKGAMQLASWYHELPESLRRLVSHNVATWNLSCLQKLTKIATTELEGFLQRVEQLMLSGGKITAEQIRASAQSTCPKTHLILGQPAGEADWQLVAEVYDLSEEQLSLLKLEAQQKSQTPEVTTDALVAALTTFGYNPSLVLPKTKTRRFSEQEVELTVHKAVETAVKEAIAEIEREREELIQQVSLKEQIISQKEAENARLRQQLAESQKLGQGEKTEPMPALPLALSEISKFNQNKSLSFTPQAQNLFLGTKNQKPKTLFNEQPLKNLPARVVREGSPAEIGKFIGSSETGNDCQVLFDQKDEGHQTIGVYKIDELEIQDPADGEFKPFSQVLKEVETNLEVAQISKELKKRSLLGNSKEVLSVPQSRKRKTAKGFAR